MKVKMEIFLERIQNVKFKTKYTETIGHVVEWYITCGKVRES